MMKKMISLLAVVGLLAHISASALSEAELQEQTRITQQGVSATQREINKTRATIGRINKKIKRLKRKCDKAAWYRKQEICAAVGIELTGQYTALAAQETYLNALLKPGKEVIKKAYVADTQN